jgi:hypothetical protein
MKHASEAALDSIQPVLLELRQLEGIREKKQGSFTGNPQRSFTFTRILRAFLQM